MSLESEEMKLLTALCEALGFEVIATMKHEDIDNPPLLVMELGATRRVTGTTYKLIKKESSYEA